MTGSEDLLDKRQHDRLGHHIDHGAARDIIVRIDKEFCIDSQLLPVSISSRGETY